MAIIGLATWALLDKVPWIGELVGNDLLTGAIYVLLVAGIIVALTSFFGCLGASREVKCMLLTVNLIMPRSYVFNKPKVYWSNYVIKKKLISVLHHRVPSVRNHINWRSARVRVPWKTNEHAWEGNVEFDETLR